jgi:thymidine kinase
MCEVLTKICSKCHLEKPLTEFNKNKGKPGGLNLYCKKCHTESDRKYRQKNKARKTITIPDFKVCACCKIEKPNSAFIRNPRNKDGLRSRCRDCHAKSNKTHREKNKARDVIVIPEFKTCPECKIEKPSSTFYTNDRNKDGLDDYCTLCNLESNRSFREKNKNRETIIVPAFKMCLGCNKEKPGLDFYDEPGNTDGLSSSCKECFAIRNRKRLYGTSEEWRIATLAAQGGACAICKFIPGPNDYDLCVDHIHGTDIVRGLPCFKCNLGIGHFKDDTAILNKAIAYLNGPTTKIRYKINLSKTIKNKILASQNFMCKICSIDLRTHGAHLDHSHKTGFVRGYLCRGCNCGLGYFKDSVELLNNVIVYLNKYTKQTEPEPEASLAPALVAPLAPSQDCALSGELDQGHEDVVLLSDLAFLV